MLSYTLSNQRPDAEFLSWQLEDEWGYLYFQQRYVGYDLVDGVYFPFQGPVSDKMAGYLSHLYTTLGPNQR